MEFLKNGPIDVDVSRESGFDLQFLIMSLTCVVSLYLDPRCNAFDDKL